MFTSSPPPPPPPPHPSPHTYTPKKRARPFHYGTAGSDQFLLSSLMNCQNTVEEFPPSPLIDPLTIHRHTEKKQSVCPFVPYATLNSVMVIQGVSCRHSTRLTCAWCFMTFASCKIMRSKTLTKLEIPLQNMTCIGSSTFLILYQVILNTNLFFSA